MLPTRQIFLSRLWACFLSAALLISCSAFPNVAGQPTASPTLAANQMTSEPTRSSTPTSSATPTLVPLPTPTLTPEPQYALPGRFVLVANSEIFLVTNVSCLRKWVGCSGTRIQLTHTPRPEQLFAAEIIIDQITASPDGKKVVFAYRESLEDQGTLYDGWDIYVLDIETCQQLENGCDSQMFKRLTEEPYSEISPAWAPDGSLIAFISNKGPYEGFNPHELYGMKPDGSDQEHIIGAEHLENAGSIHTPGWSPDSQELVFTATTSRYRHPDTFIYKAGRDGSNVEQLTYLPHEENMNKMDLRPKWSPDGAQILFESNRDRLGLYLMNTDGTEITRLAKNVYAVLPSWSPDEVFIAFLDSIGFAVLEVQTGKIFHIKFEGFIDGFLWIK